jgi:uncharacterized protein (TIGR02231 family)
VYPDRALVTRTARTDLAAGPAEIVLDGLPGALVDASVRATGAGGMPVRITGVEVSREHLARPDDPRVRRLQEEIRSLNDRDRSLQDEVQAVQSLRQYLQAVQAKATDQPKEVHTPRIDVDGIRGVYTFLADNLAGLALRQREAEIARRDLQERLQKLQRDLAGLRAPAATVRKSVAVGLEAARPGLFELQVTYLVPGAGWTPGYTARALPDSGEVELTYGARVTQQTGEPWEGVALTLSTARPALGGRAPALDPWVLRLAVPPRVAAKAAGVIALAPPEGRAAGGAANQVSMADGKETDRLAKLEEQATAAQADVVAGGPSVVFKVARPVSIASDGREHKTTVAVERLKGAFAYRAVPKRSPFAYLVARIAAGQDLPLLAGPVEVFRTGDYLGRSQLEAAAPGQPFDLHLGVDEGIVVKREETVHERGEGGVFTKTRQTRIAYEITVENFKRTPHNVTIMDRLPIPQDQEIEVGSLRLSHDPTAKDERGLVTWTFPLAPQEKRVIRVEFTVSHPADRSIAGL